jgi:hypothetical protein
MTINSAKVRPAPAISAENKGFLMYFFAIFVGTGWPGRRVAGLPGAMLYFGLAGGPA